MSAQDTPSASPSVPSRTMKVRDKTVALDGEPKMVGILNVTPDSFFDGRPDLSAEAALQRALQMVADGAAMIDVGGQSTRPGYEEISAEEEISRIVPVIELLAASMPVPISVDTYKLAVARVAVAAGAEIINDIHGFQRTPELAGIVAGHRCGAILMHNDPTLKSRTGDVMAEIARFLERSIEIALKGGVSRDRVILDPGVGFGKTHEQNLEVLARIGELKSLGFPLMLGASSKSVIGNVLTAPVEDRLEGTLATTTLAVWQNVEFLRVHDVRANLRAAKMTAAIRRLRPLSS